MITVLFAEDEQALRDLFQQVFRMNGFHVLTANDGKEALRVAAQFEGNIDLLVSNVYMPYLNGPDLAREVRRARPDIKVMLLSGDPEAGILLLDKGWQFLRKPVQPHDVIKKIKEILDQPSPAAVDRDSDGGTHSQRY